MFRNRKWFVDRIDFFATKLGYRVVWHHDHAIRLIDVNSKEPTMLLSSMAETLAYLSKKMEDRK